MPYRSAQGRTPRLTAVSGRHVTRQLKQWAPTALTAVAAITPAAALLVALGAAGSGYLLHRSDLAAAGSVLAAGGLLVERLQGRTVRRRMRRRRWEHRSQLQELRGEVDQARAERDGARRAAADAQHALDLWLKSQLAALQQAPALTGPGLLGSAGAAGAATNSRVAPPVTSAWFETEPATLQIPRIARPAPAAVPAGPIAAGPIAAGSGLPAGLSGPPVHPLPPGPREPVSGPMAIVVDLAAVPRETASPQPLTPVEVDARVYAALASADADELSLVLEGRLPQPAPQGFTTDPRAGRHAGRLPDGQAPATGSLVVVGARTVADSSGLPVRGRHSA